MGCDSRGCFDRYNWLPKLPSAIEVQTLDMGLLANFRIRTKVFVALLPLASMVIVAALYASIEMNRIDARYSDLIDKDVKALYNLTIARVLSNRFGWLLYQEVAEPDADRMRVIDADLDATAAEFSSSVALARAESPSMAEKVDAAKALFEQAVSDSRAIRAAT